MVVCAADHATVDELAMRARASRVAAGEVDAEGAVAGNRVVGVGDEVVTTRKDRRLVTSRGGWVRNGDRWQVLACHRDDSLLVEDLAGRGRVELPGDYVRDEVALAYAVTIHKAQGLTVDRSILLVDERTSGEGLYVGMSRAGPPTWPWRSVARTTPSTDQLNPLPARLTCWWPPWREAAPKSRHWRSSETLSPARSRSPPWHLAWPTSTPGLPRRCRPIDPRS